MPASDVQDPRRGKLLQGLFWGGIGLAPLAMLILLFGQSTGSLRVAVILSVLTVVAVSVSIAMRPSVDMVRVDIEHRLLDEVEQVRALAREDVNIAAHNTHRVLTERIYELTETIDALRAQTGRIAQLTETVAALRAHVDELQHAPAVAAAPPPEPAHLPPPAGTANVVRHTETVHVTRRTTTVDAGDDDARGTVYGSRAAVEGEWRERPDDRRGDDYRDDDRRHESRHGSRRPEPRRPDERRHEDARDDWHHDDDRDRPQHRRSADGRSPAGGPPDERRPDDRPYEGRRHAARGSDDRRRAERDDFERPDRDLEHAGFDRPGFDRGEFARADFEVARREHDPRWEGVGAGDRWASVRSDEHGRELRVGERIASVRKDDRGTEFRVEDRWTAMRREDGRERGDDGYREADWEATFRSLSSKPAAVPALPAAPGESPDRFLDQRPHEQPARSRVRDHGRDGDDERDRSPGRSHDRDSGRAPDRDRAPDRGRGGDRDRRPARDDSWEPADRDRPRADRDRDSDRSWTDAADRDFGPEPAEWERAYDRAGRDHPTSGAERGREYGREPRRRDHDDDRPYPPRPRAAHPSERER